MFQNCPYITTVADATVTVKSTELSCDLLLTVPLTYSKIGIHLDIVWCRKTSPQTRRPNLQSRIMILQEAEKNLTTYTKMMVSWKSLTTHSFRHSATTSRTDRLTMSYQYRVPYWHAMKTANHHLKLTSIQTNPNCTYNLNQYHCISLLIVRNCNLSYFIYGSFNSVWRWSTV